MRKMIAPLLAAALCLSACSSGGGSDGGQLFYDDPYASFGDDHDGRSQAIYDDVLGDFQKAYQAAEQAQSLSQRYAGMAIAEAKLLAAGVMLPLTSDGGTYQISRLAPYTVPHVLWGNDSSRFYQALVTTTPITAAHREEMKAQWAKLKGTGTYGDWAAAFLTKAGYTLKDSYCMSYSGDPQTWDVLATSRAEDTRALVNLYDGLYEYDGEGTLCPALAQSYTKTEHEDGTVSYAFHLRSGVNWVDAQGRTVGQVQADDFVAGLQHMMDAAGGLEYLVDGRIVNADGYISGTITDFSQVGVRAVDEYTVEYTLVEDTPYFLTMLGYSVFAPLCRSYYLAQGGKFGGEFDSADPAYTYGQSPDHIAVCGAYLVTNATAKNTIVFRENPTYWNREKQTLRSIIWLYNDGEDQLKGYQDTMAGTVDSVELNAASAAKARSDGVFSELAYVSGGGATTYFAFCNVNRQAYGNFNDGSAGASPKTQTEKLRTRAAMYDLHFRRALAMAVDRGGYNAQTAGEELRLTALRNTFTPATFVTLPEGVTVEIGGRSVEYPAGTAYGEIVQDQLAAEGLPVTVFDPEAEAGIGSGDGFDGWYHPEAARQELELAVEALGKEGIVVSAQSPIYLDLPYFSGNENGVNQAQAYKKSVESALNGAVQVNLVPCSSRSEVLYAGYYATLGYESNYDIYTLSGWGPDYGDPQTYLDTLLPQYAGFLTKMLGIF